MGHFDSFVGSRARVCEINLLLHKKTALDGQAELGEAAIKEFSAERLSLSVDGDRVDAYTICPKEKQGEASRAKRWTVDNLGEGQKLHSLLDQYQNPVLYQLAETCNTNLFITGYPGIGVSEGFPSPSTMKHALKAAIEHVENTHAPEELLFYTKGTVGAALQRGALRDFVPKERKKYTVLKQEVCSSLACEATEAFVKGIKSCTGVKLGKISQVVLRGFFSLCYLRWEDRGASLWHCSHSKIPEILLNKSDSGIALSDVHAEPLLHQVSIARVSLKQLQKKQGEELVDTLPNFFPESRRYFSKKTLEMLAKRIGDAHHPS